MRVKQVILHMPETKEHLENLEIEVAKIHAKAVIKRIQNLSCPLSQKKELHRYIIQKEREKQLKL